MIQINKVDLVCNNRLLCHDIRYNITYSHNTNECVIGLYNIHADHLTKSNPL